MAGLTSEAADSYRQTEPSSAWAGKSPGEVMEQEFLLAPKKVLANCPAAQEGRAAHRPHSVQCQRGAADLNRVFSQPGKEYFRYLNPTNTHSVEETEPEASGVGSRITGIKAVLQG